jgi:hypothetical protein
VGFDGVTLIDTRAAALTVKVAESESPCSDAPIVVVPIALLVAKPCVPSELLMVATAERVEVQWAELVTFCVDPSE